MDQIALDQAEPKKRDDAAASGAGDLSPEFPGKTRKIPEPPSSAQAGEKAIAEANDGKKKKRAFVSTGEKLHSWITYGGADWILNSAFGVTFTVWGARTLAGKKYYTEPVQKAFKYIFRPLIQNEGKIAKLAADEAQLTKMSRKAAKLARSAADEAQQAERAAQTTRLDKIAAGWNDFLSIMVGGTVINPIITILEKHKNKKAIAKSLDHMIYGKDKVDNDPKFQQAYKEIDEEAPKDTKGVWIARGLALAPLWYLSANNTTRMFMKSNKTLKIPFTKDTHLNFDTIAGGTKKVAESIGIKPERLPPKVKATGKSWWLETLKDETSGQQMSHWQALHNTIAFDYGLTIPYAIMHMMWYNAIAGFFSKHKKDPHKTAAADKADKAAMTDVKPVHEGKEAAKDTAPLPTVSQISREAHLSNVAQSSQLSTI